MRAPFRRAIALALLAVLSAADAGERGPEPVTVFAAASLTDVLTEIAAAFQAETGIAVRHSFAASSALARQIESGAPAEVFVSADLEWMDYLQGRGHVDPGSRRIVAGNELVLIAPRDSPVELTIAPGFALAAALGRGRLAIGDPGIVPAGRYARAALTRLGVWADVANRLVPAENVRAALAYVSRGEAPLGIVYRTDARVDPGVRVVAAFPADTHAPIRYPAAATTPHRAPAMKYLDFLAGAAGRRLFARHGFAPP